MGVFNDHVSNTSIDTKNVITKSFITAYYKKSKGLKTVFFDEVSSGLTIPYDCRLTEIFCRLVPKENKRDYQITLELIIVRIGINPISLLNSSQNVNIQNFPTNIHLSKNDILTIAIHKKGKRGIIDQDECVFTLVFTI